MTSSREFRSSGRQFGKTTAQLRELDALVAEKVLGWDWEADAQVWWHKGSYGWEPAELPHYSTDIAAAWTVVEKLQGGLRFELRRRPDAGFFAIFGEEMCAEADTAPHAICLAALKAAGVM